MMFDEEMDNRIEPQTEEELLLSIQRRVSSTYLDLKTKRNRHEATLAYHKERVEQLDLFTKELQEILKSITDRITGDEKFDNEFYEKVLNQVKEIETKNHRSHDDKFDAGCRTPVTKNTIGKANKNPESPITRVVGLERKDKIALEKPTVKNDSGKMDYENERNEIVVLGNSEDTCGEDDEGNGDEHSLKKTKKRKYIIDSEEDSNDDSELDSEVNSVRNKRESVRKVKSSRKGILSIRTGSPTRGQRRLELQSSPKKTPFLPIIRRYNPTDLTNRVYFESIHDLEDLDKKAESVRKCPEMGTDDVNVLLHLHMQSAHDNLYLVSHSEPTLSQFPVIHLVQVNAYHRWATTAGYNIDEKIDEGIWECTQLEFCYKDDMKATEDCTWRYVLYSISNKDRKDFSYERGIYSFDEASVREEFDDEIKKERKFLLNFRSSKDSWVYGPFDFYDKIKYKIQRSDWVKALPKIIKNNCCTGTLYWKGFSDDVLMDAGVSKDMIEDAKKLKPNLPDSAFVPVYFKEMEEEKRLERMRLLRYREKERPTYGPGFWDHTKLVNEDSKSLKPQKKRVAGILVYMKERKNVIAEMKRKEANDNKKKKLSKK